MNIMKAVLPHHYPSIQVELLSRVHSSDYIAFVNSLSHQLQLQASADSNDAMPFTPQVQKQLYHQSGIVNRPVKVAFV